MIDASILGENLNKQVPYADYFRAFGYTDRERVFLRGFDDKKGTTDARNWDTELWNFSAIMRTLEHASQNGWGIFYVVNGGGHSDADVLKASIARAQFCDFDDYSFEEQIERLNGFGLEPSIIVMTRKSLHPYWLLRDGDIKKFRNLQIRLNEYFGSDASIKNESRVMRLYGFNHQKTDEPTMVKLIKFTPDLTYTQEQIEKALPPPKPKPPKPKQPAQPGQAKVKVGEGYKHGVATIGRLIATSRDTLDDDAILAATRVHLLNVYEEPSRVEEPEEFKKVYGPAVVKFRKAAEEADNEDERARWAYNMRAWQAEHPGEEFDKDRDGWNEVYDAGIRARAEGKTFEDSKPAQRTSATPTEDGGDSILSCLDLQKDGKPRKVFHNYVTLVRNHPLLKGKIRHNALSGRPEIEGVPWDMLLHPLRDNDIDNIRYRYSECYGLQTEKEILRAACLVSFENAYHPVVGMLQSLEWDQVPRIADLFPRYLGAERSDYTTAVTTLLLHGAIQRVMNPGVKFDYCVVLQDTKQGSGKSTMCRFLAVNDDWFCDCLGDLGDSKESFETIRGKWICELGEMIATRKTKDIEQIKGYITRLADEYRDPYGHFSESRKRQCVFIGTSNKPQFLPDDRTGNRRFLPLLCDGNKAERHPMDDEEETRQYIRQCYAEAIQLGNENGWSLVLDRKFDAELDAIREASTAEDELSGRIQTFLDQSRADIVCTRMIYEALNRQDGRLASPTKWELQEISDCMNLKIEGWERYRGKNRDNDRAKFGFNRPFEITIGLFTSFTANAYGAQRAWQRIPKTGPVTIATFIATDHGYRYSGGNNDQALTDDGQEVPFLPVES